MPTVGVCIPNTPPRSKKKVLHSSRSHVGLNLPHLLIVCSNILYVLLNLFWHSAPPASWPFFSRLSSCASQNSSKADWISLACVFHTARPCCPSASRSFTSALLFRKKIKACRLYTSTKGCGRSTGPCSSTRDSPLHGADPLDLGQVLVCSWGKVLARLGETGQNPKSWQDLFCLAVFILLTSWSVRIFMRAEHWFIPSCHRTLALEVQCLIGKCFFFKC